MPTVAFPTVPSDLDRDLVLSKCAYFTKVGLWPLPLTGVDPAAWLDNFTAGEMRHAAYLLNAFLFFPGHVVDQIFVSACRDVLRAATEGEDSAALPNAWRHFLDAVVVTAVRGERPAPTDSGALFTRRARGLLGIPTGRILEQAEAVAHAHRHGGDLLLVDDFVGTANQFCETFKREFPVDGSQVSFASIAQVGNVRYFYAPIVATARGCSRILAECAATTTCAGHVLPDRYGALHPESLIWPNDLIATASDFVHTASQRAGIPDAPGSPNHWEGFGGLALVLAFDHGTPDATLPLIWWQAGGWTPLRARG